jgi:hypothetical protein
VEKGWKPFSPKNKLVQGSEGNEEKGYPVPDHNKTDKLSQGTQRSPQEHPEKDILQEITENFMQMLLDKVNQNVQEYNQNFFSTRGTEEIPAQ